MSSIAVSRGWLPLVFLSVSGLPDDVTALFYISVDFEHSVSVAVVVADVLCALGIEFAAVKARIRFLAHEHQTVFLCRHLIVLIQHGGSLQKMSEACVQKVRSALMLYEIPHMAAIESRRHFKKHRFASVSELDLEVRRSVRDPDLPGHAGCKILALARRLRVSE